jgi:hypothetical protein
MKSLRDHVVEHAGTRGAREKPRRSRELATEVELARLVRSLGLGAATVSLPAGNRSRRESGADEYCVPLSETANQLTAFATPLGRRASSGHIKSHVGYFG